MKMSFKEFCEYVEKNIVKYIDEPEKKTVKIEKVVKPNDLVLHGLSIRTQDNLVAPLFYLEDFYEAYSDESDVDTALKIIGDSFKIKPPEGVDSHMSFDYEDIKDMLEFAVVDEQLNGKRLEKLANLHLGNGMYATFHIVVICDDKDRYSVAITKDMASKNNYDLSQMFIDAGNNMKRKYPATFTSFEEVLYELSTGEYVDRPLFKDIHKLRRKSGAYTFTNVAFRWGAYNFWIGNTQKKIAELFNSSYYVIPSSIHDLIINPIHSSQSPDELGEIVGKVNAQIDPNEVLSYKVFIYDKKSNRLSIAYEPGRKEKWNSEKVS